MTRIAKRPLDPAAREAADDEFYASNPDMVRNGRRVPLDPSDPAQSGKRRQWMDSYTKNGGEVKGAPPKEENKQKMAGAKADMDAAMGPAPPGTAVCPCMQNGKPDSPPPPPAVQPEPQQPKCNGATKLCQLLETSVSCLHFGGRRSSPQGLIEVVPPEAGEEVTLTAQIDGCAKPATWDISGFNTTTQEGNEARFRVVGWRIGNPTNWLAPVSPHTYRITARTDCGGRGRTFDVRAYPSDSYSLKIDPSKWKGLKESIEKAENALEKFIEKKWGVELGKIAGGLEAGWQEDKSSHLAFYAYTLSLQCDPLFSIWGRAPWGPTALLPRWITKYGEACIYIKISGGIGVKGTFSRVAPEKHKGDLQGTGKIELKLGATLFLANKKVIYFDANGGGGVTLKVKGKEDAEQPTVKGEWNLSPITAQVTIAVFYGLVEVNRKLKLIEEGDKHDLFEVSWPPYGSP